ERAELTLLRLLHPGGLSLQAAQEVQLGPPDARGADHVDFRNGRGVQRKDALDALTKGDLSHRERGAGAAAMQPDHASLEDLNPLLVALAHLYVHTHRIARFHTGSFGDLRLLDQLYRAHLTLLLFGRSARPAPSLFAQHRRPRIELRPRSGGFAF